MTLLLLACLPAGPGPAPRPDTDPQGDRDTAPDSADTADSAGRADSSDSGAPADSGEPARVFEGYPNLDNAWAVWPDSVLAGAALYDVTGDGVVDTPVVGPAGALDLHSAYGAGSAQPTCSLWPDANEDIGGPRESTDVDGDGVADLVFSEWPGWVGTSFTAVALGPMTDGTSRWWQYVSPGGVGGAGFPCDMDGDGLDEVYVHDVADDGSVGFARFLPYSGAVVVWDDADAVWVGHNADCANDLSGDGRDDLQFFESESDSIYFVDNTSDGGDPQEDAFARVVIGSQLVYPLDSSACDLDQDGFADLLSGPTSGYDPEVGIPMSLAITYGPLLGTYGDAGAWDWLGSSTANDNYVYPPVLCVGDATGDGASDLVGVTPVVNTTRGDDVGGLLLIPGPFDGSEDIPDGPRVFGPTDDYPQTDAAYVLPDIDGDGILDIVLGTLGQDTYVVASSSWVSGEDVR